MLSIRVIKILNASLFTKVFIDHATTLNIIESARSAS